MKIVGPVAATNRGHGPLKVKSIAVAALEPAIAPIRIFDDFRVSGAPFQPHPHAGFSAVSYIFEDSPGACRSRDSLGGDYTVGSGGIVWSQAARGMMHEELPADPGVEIHGLQIFVDLGSKAKQVPPQVLCLDGGDVPVWSDAHGNRVRVAMGEYAGIASPLVPAEPCDLLDVTVKSQVDFSIPAGRNAFVYCESGVVGIQAGDRSVRMVAGEAIAVSGQGTLLMIAESGAHLVLISGLALQEPVVSHGPFIMNSAAGIEDAMARYERGEMGRLKPTFV